MSGRESKRAGLMATAAGMAIAGAAVGAPPKYIVVADSGNDCVALVDAASGGMVNHGTISLQSGDGARIQSIGRAKATGGYRRFAWDASDLLLREWFASTAQARGLDLVEDRFGNQWAWWGDPDRDGPGVVLGSHLDSVPDGGAYDGPLGVVSAFAALDRLRGDGHQPVRPLAIANFADEEGARFGIALAGSRVITGLLDPDRARSLREGDAAATQGLKESREHEE